MIRNFNSLANRGNFSNTYLKKRALKILEAGLFAAQPKNFLKTFVDKNYILLGKNRIFLSNYRKIFVIAYGKAADSMAEYVSKKIKVSKGIVVIPKYTKSSLSSKKFKVFYSGHPLPDKESVRAGKTILEFVNSCSKGDFILFLVSGGGSSLLALPDNITLTEKKHVTELLLKCGATIDEFNTVRKHLSRIKGGRLVQNMNCDGCVLVMSDVVSNDLSVISSGCTYNDSTTFSDAMNIIKKYSLEKKLPKKVITHLKHGLITKTVRANRPKIKNKIIATNQDCINAMVLRARSLGFTTKVYSPIKQDVGVSAKKIVQMIPRNKNSCLIFGGEPTVQVKGKGKGGRNQELVLQILKLIHNSNHGVVVCSTSTDGIDGNTTCSGAFIESTPYLRQKKNSFSLQEISSYLANNDSHSFFKKYRGLIKTGPTKTNLMDIGLIIKY